ncbi:MAG: hypothetical protein ACR2NT_07950 [Acidimicrobiia bacterium]
MSIDRSYEFSSPPAGERMVLRVGAACGVAGAVIAIAGNALHPRTSVSEIGDTAAYLALVNGSEKLGRGARGHRLRITLVSVHAIRPFPLPDADARGALGRVAFSFAVLGGAVNLVDLLIDGTAMPELARQWHEAPVADQNLILHTAEAVRASDFGLLSGIMIAFFGFPFLLFGWATAASGTFPRWLGLTGAASGLAILGVGFWQEYAGVSELTYLNLFPPLAALLSIWFGVVSVLIWRQTR